ncbi:MAG: hypothetical protein AAGE52_34610, partial [Myxococcota bacterium]
ASALLRAGHDVTGLAQRVPGDEAQLSALRALGGRFRPLPEDAVAVAYPRAEFPEAPVVATMREGELREAVETVHPTHEAPRAEPRLLGLAARER